MSTHPTSAGTADLATLPVGIGSPTMPMTSSRSSTAAPAPPTSSATRSAVRLRSSLPHGARTSSAVSRSAILRCQSTLRPGLQQSRPMLSVWRDLAASDRARDEIADALRDMRVDFEGRSGRAGDLMAKDSSWFAFMAGCLSDLDSTMLDAVIEFEEMHAGYEADRLLPEISCPVLLIQADPAYGGALSDEDVAIARSLLRDVRVARIDQVGHSRYPGKIAAVLRDFFSR